MVLNAANTGGFFYLVPFVVFFPVIGLLINAFIGKWFGEKVIGTIACLASGLAFLVAVLLGLALIGQPQGMSLPYLNWITIGSLQLQWAFRVDTLSVTMMLVVGGVGTLIHIYAVGYMHEDVRHNEDPGRFRRFFVYFNLFIAAMMVLVSANNYMMLFIGWEGVGLCSYLLISFWYEKGKDGIGNAVAGKKAFITNRIGDFGFLIAAFLMFKYFQPLVANGIFAFDFDTVNQLAPQVAQQFPTIILAITLFMLLGVTGKSAQLPLYVWLPDAMAGPTPVSALIHAATMVTAGVYLVARSYSLYSLVPVAQNWVAIVGGVTALFASTIAVAQFDIKKVLAYSTISQLGFMVAAVGMGAYIAGMFHLVMHAFFKALLFLSSGSVIQGIERGQHHVEHDPVLRKRMKHEHKFDPQDMRNMGGLRHNMKTTYWVYLIGALALAGIFPLAGFWSKDEILAEAFALKPGIYWILTIAAFFTAFYMGRQIIMVFFGESRSEPAVHAQESPAIMTVPLIVLAFLSIVGGFMNFPTLHNFTAWLEHTIKPLAEAGGEAVASGGFNFVVAIISTVLALVALALSWYLYERRTSEMQELPLNKRADDPLRLMLGPVFTVLENKYWVDELYGYVVIKPYVWLSSFLADKVEWAFWHDFFHETILAGGYIGFTKLLTGPIDLGLIDGIANFLGDGFKELAAQIRKLQSGYVRTYALSIFIGVVFIIGYLIIRFGFYSN
jgi:NADH-quinone oxidoreductase subunit L